MEKFFLPYYQLALATEHHSSGELTVTDQVGLLGVIDLIKV